MKAHLHRGLLGAGALFALSGLVAAFASCAETDDRGNEFRDDASTTLPPLPDGGARDGAKDASCDARDDACVTNGLSCEEAAWCPVSTGASAAYVLTTVWGSSKTDVWAGGSGGTVVHFDGSAWVPVATDVKNTFRAITGSGPNDVWAVSASDVLLHAKGFDAAGVTWSREVANADEFSAGAIYAAFATPAGDLRLGGATFGLVAPNGDFGIGNQYVRRALGDGGGAWTGVNGTMTVRGIWASAVNDVWLLGEDTQTASWQLGLSVHGTAGDGGSLVWKNVDTQAQVRLNGIWGSSRTDVWAVGDVGTLRHLAADGSRWDVVDSKVTTNLHAVWGASATDVWAVGDAGTILHYDGKDWKQQTAAFAEGRAKPDLHGVWGADKDSVWIVGDGIALRATGLGGGT